MRNPVKEFVTIRVEISEVTVVGTETACGRKEDGRRTTVIGETGTGNIIISVVTVVVTSRRDAVIAIGRGVGSKDSGSERKTCATESVTEKHDPHNKDIPETSTIAGGSDTVGSAGARTGGVPHYTFAASDGATSTALVPVVGRSSLGAIDPTTLLYEGREFVAVSPREVSLAKLATRVLSVSGEGIGVATTPVSPDTVSSAHKGWIIPDDTLAL